MLETCSTRLSFDPSDEWALAVQSRVHLCIDFIAAEVRYHHDCQLRFRMEKNLNENQNATKNARGRQKDEKKNECFKTACEWLESEVSIHTMKEFRMKLTEISGDIDMYDPRYLKRLLQEHYGDHVFFSEEVGKTDLIYFRKMADFIINEKYKEKKIDIEEESKRIIQAAANLIKADIREKGYDMSFYPTSNQIKENWIPDSLRCFLEAFTKSKVKH